MKRILIIILTAFFALNTQAQNVIQHKKGEDMSQYMLDSVKYVLPDFTAGVVIFKDGRTANGPLNISTISQKLLFISPEGEIQEVLNQNSIDRVSVKGHSFVQSKQGFIELLDMVDDVILGSVKRVKFLESEKKGAFGTTSETTSVTSISSISTEGQRYELAQNVKTPFTYRVTPYLGRNGKFSYATKKYMLKCFPSKKNEIETYLKENKVDFENLEDVRALFEYLK
ncbi:MAG TPA: hypothetical protein PL115_03935 [Bacteroidales bacterium]|jgi:hypothetical protein|nr:hypothetical protein [Bacteroidales bacterium]HKM13229.1 hypothetical protein [Bacteroidales bacterium]HPB88855.1 hypothetical protein [Bacteroidales bacterium]HQN23545.1 hypothetical protein [Bacteroidales bacterium]HQP79000.1 hypothetical protein [Bacteroidales bacterium]